MSISFYISERRAKPTGEKQEKVCPVSKVNKEGERDHSASIKVGERSKKSRININHSNFLGEGTSLHRV